MVQLSKIQTSKCLLVALCAACVFLGASCNKLKSRDQMNQGVTAYKNSHYADAVKHFKQAVELDPTSQSAQLFLATSYMTQWVPGVDSPDNLKNFDMAKETFNQVLKREPSNSLALASMASMAFNSAQGSASPDQKAAAWEEARKWNDRRIEVDPKDSEAYYYLGVIDWAEAYTPIQTARVEEHLRAEDPGPLKDAKVRAELQGKYQKTIDDGIANLKKCLAIDKENEDAMSYMNLLLRKKADLEDSPEASRADIAQAEDWSNKSLDMKKIKANRPAKKTEAN